MNASKQIIFWKRKDVDSLERLVLNKTVDAIYAVSSVISLASGGLRVDHKWKLTKQWRTESLEVKKWNGDDFQRLILERSGRSWSINGMPRMDLMDTAEPDISISPFSNSLPIRRMRADHAVSLELTACYVDVESMEVKPSKQRYDKVSSNTYRFFDRGLFYGHEAVIEVDRHLLLTTYEKVFVRIYPK